MPTSTSPNILEIRKGDLSLSFVPKRCSFNGEDFMNDWSDIGEKLKEAREARGLLLEDIAHQTRIPVASLRAIEANCYSVLPGPAYAKSFVQQYAGYLNYDASEWLQNFQIGNTLANSANFEYLDEPVQKGAREPYPAKKSSSPQDIPRESLGQPLLMLLITGGLIAAAIWGYSVIEKQLDAEKPSPTIATDKEIIPPKTVVGATQPVENPASEPAHETQASGLPTIVISEEPPPPRAIIVEDDEEAPGPLTHTPIAGD